MEADNHTANCLICNESIAVLKEYNLRRHYETKHQSTYSKLSDKLRTEKFQSMKRNLLGQRSLFVKKFTENESITRTSYKIVQKIIERGKPFIDGNYVLKVNDFCPKNSNSFASISLLASSVVRRTEELGENIVAQLQQKAENFLWYSLAMDESTDLTTTSQILIFIRGVNLDFKITEQLALVYSMHGTTTGENLFLEVEKILQCYSFHLNKLQCVAVDGGKNVAGLKKGLVGRIMSKLEDLHLGKAFFCTVLYISKYSVRNIWIFLA